jgi:hypothetical protein
MATISSYTFNNMGRIGNDVTDQTQRTMYNTRFANHTLSNYFSQNVSDGHIAFATNQPALMTGGTVLGAGVNSALVDTESILNLKQVNERHYEKLQLFERPFLTVPYLGKGSCDPLLESQLQQGELITEKKSVSTIMEKSFSKYSLYPTDDKMEERVKNPAFTVEESALNGWVRGGMSTREMSEDSQLSKQNRPSSFF